MDHGASNLKGTGKSTLIMDSPVLLMHHDPYRSWITDPDPDHLKGTYSKIARYMCLYAEQVISFFKSE